MENGTIPPMRRVCPLSVFVAILVGLIAVIVHFGWIFHSYTLVQILPGLAPMQATTALGFVFFAGALFFLSISPLWDRGSLKTWFSLALLIWGLINLAQHLLGFNIGVDHLLSEPFVADRSPAPGRMSLLTSLCFVLGGGAMTLATVRNKGVWCEISILILSCALAGIAGSSLFRYVLGLPPLLWLEYRLSEMAIHTSLAFLLLALE